MRRGGNWSEMAGEEGKEKMALVGDSERVVEMEYVLYKV